MGKHYDRTSVRPEGKMVGGFNLYRSALLWVVLLVLPLLTGCGASSLISAGAGPATERWGHWADVRKAEEKTKQAVAAMERAKAESQPAINITTNEQMAMYALHEANEALKKVAIALSGNGQYKDLVSTTPMPKGAFAETIESIGHMGKDILDTPTAVVGVAGIGIKSIVDAANAGAPNTFMGDVNADNAFNHTSQAQVNTTSSTISQQPFEVRPEVVEPTVVTPAQ